MDNRENGKAEGGGWGGAEVNGEEQVCGRLTEQSRKGEGGGD